jgi:peptidoglycan hydrolase CwlO-like protein
MRLAKVKIFTPKLILVVFLILFKCSICVGQTSNSLEDMNKRELRSLTDYLIFKTDSLQELLNKTVNINTDLTSALSDSIMKIAKLNKQIESANNTIYLKDTEIKEINSQIKILNDEIYE